MEIRAFRGGATKLALVLALFGGGAACKVQDARTPGSDPGAPGFVDTSSMDLAAGPPEAIDPADTARITKRGVDLYYMEVGMRLAYDRGLPRAGRYDAAALLPLASVDEGAHSGQVEFYRWREADVGEGGALEVEKAQRWLVVPFLLRPDRVLENEQFSEEIDEKSDIFRMIDGLLVGAMAARDAHPGASWHMHPFRESRRDGTRRIRSTRIYMFGLDADSPDLEVLVRDPVKKRGSPSVEGITLVHEPADYAGATVRLRQDHPGPITVARVKSRGLEAGDVPVESANGTRWKISAETGVIELATQTPSG